jgi:hypothetical protein
VHWVEPQLVAEITYLTWTADNLLRHTAYVGLRKDKPAEEVRREAAQVRWRLNRRHGNFRFGRILLKNSNFSLDHNSEDRWQPRWKFP